MNESQSIMEQISQTDLSQGVAFANGEYMPQSQASISILDWGFNKSDVTYDVVHVWNGAFFRLEYHLDRFARSMEGLRMSIPYNRQEIATILTECVRRSGLRNSYVAMITTRGVQAPGMPRKPSLLTNRFYAYAVPWIDVISPEIQARGAHLIIAKTQRIPPESINPTFKNYHWGDLVSAMFEAEDAGADNALLLDRDGYLTEGPGFNVFIIRDGCIVSPDRGALEGITRQTVFDMCEELGLQWKIAPVRVDDIRMADEVLTATTAGGVMPVSRVDDVIYSNDRPGPISAKLRETYWRWHDEGRDATRIIYD